MTVVFPANILFVLLDEDPSVPVIEAISYLEIPIPSPNVVAINLSTSGSKKSW